MAYHNLSLPSGLAPDMVDLICKQLEPQLVDAHAMLRLPISSDPGLQGGCNLSVVQVLLSLVSGCSVTLYDPNALSRRRDRGSLFKSILVDHYPWDEERHIAGAQLDGGAAEQLYQLFRNPLAHALGIIDPRDNPAARKVIIEKGAIPEADIELTERSAKRPLDWTDPTLREEGADLVLWVRSLYWGVRRMIESVAAARALSKGTSPISVLPSNVTQWRST